MTHSNLSDIESSIIGIDTALSLCRELWLAAKTEEDKVKYRVKIDGLLDQRLPLMKRRDELKEAV